MGDHIYLQNGGIITHNSYRFNEPTYKGIVFYTDWDDIILEGYEFEDGECIARELVSVEPIDSNNTTVLFKFWNKKIYK